jgi:hypothetical protein
MKFTMEWVWNCIINKKTDKATRWCPAEDDLVLFLQGTLASRYAVPLEDIQRFRCYPLLPFQLTVVAYLLEQHFWLNRNYS